MKKKGIIIAIILLLALLAGVLILVFALKDKPPEDEKPAKPIFGVWWWNDELDDTYLEFAKSQNITEIYYCSSKFNNETANFIKNAKDKEMSVYWLAGEYEWIYDYESLKNKLNKFIKYQTDYEYKFSGVHFDIEPHQHPEFDTKRTEIIGKFVELCFNLKQDYPTLYIEYDLPFWLEDEITFNGSTKPAYQFVIDYASKVTLMSYRDTSETIYSVSKDEIEYAKSVGKTLNLGVETKSSEGDNVSFMEEGKLAMLTELAKLRNLIPSNFGITVHQIYTWKTLQD